MSTHFLGKPSPKHRIKKEEIKNSDNSLHPLALVIPLVLLIMVFGVTILTHFQSQESSYLAHNVQRSILTGLTNPDGRVLAQTGGGGGSTTPPSDPCRFFNANTIFPILPSTILPTPADPDDPTVNPDPNIGCTPAFWNLRVFLVIMYKMLGLLNWTAGALAILLTVYAGLLYISGFASEANTKTAKKIVITAYTGLIIVLSARLIVNFAVRQVTNQNVDAAIDTGTGGIINE